jgi:hypothetical protein
MEYSNFSSMKKQSLQTTKQQNDYVTDILKLQNEG